MNHPSISRVSLPCLVLLVACAVLFPVVAPAQSPDSPSQLVRVRMTLFHVMLAEEHRFGIALSSEEIAALAGSEGIPSLGRVLDEYGEAAIAAQVDAQGAVGGTIRGFSGAEMPHLNTIVDRAPDGGAVRRSQSQVTVTGGVTMLVTLRQEGGTVLGDYDVQSDSAFVKPVNDASLLARLRANIRGTIEISGEEKVHVVRQVHTTDGETRELVCVIEVL